MSDNTKKVTTLADLWAKIGKPIATAPDSEAVALKERARQAQEARDYNAEMNQGGIGTPAVQQRAVPTAPQDRASAQRAYGSYPGEQRIDTSDMTRDLGSPNRGTTPAAVRAVAPVYDDGGDVSQNNMARMMAVPLGHTDVGAQPIPEYMGGDTQAKPKPKSPYGVGRESDPGLAHPAYMPGGEPQPDAPLGAMNLPSGAFTNPPKLYDDGGDVNVNDGKHQLAILQEGEKVLTPKEARAYDAGKNTAFSGPIFENPKGIRPMLDTEIPRRAPKVYPGGATMNIDNTPLGNPVMSPMGKASHSTRAYAPAQPALPVPRELQSPLRVYDTGGDVLSPEEQAAYANAQKTLAGPTALPHDVYVPLAQSNDEDTHAAAMKGKDGVADLATAGLHRALLSSRAPEGMNQGSPDAGMEAGTAFPKATTAFPKSTTAMPPAPAPTNPPLLSGDTGPSVSTAAPVKPTYGGNNRDLHKAKLADYDSKIMAAMDMAAQTNDPAFAEQADRLRAAKMTYQAQTPWGSTMGAHPGALGELGHIAGRIGNVAGNLFAAPEMALIPGTDLYKQRQAASNSEQLKLDELANTGRQAEVNKANMIGKTPAEQTFADLMHGGPGGRPRINPDTNAPFTTQEANVASQGTGKTTIELDTQDLMRQVNPATGKNYTRLEAHEEAARRLAGTKPLNEQERKVADYLQAQHLEDTPANRDAARVAMAKRDVESKQEASMPFFKQRTNFQNQLTTTRELLVQQNADANTRGIESDKLQYTENARNADVLEKIKIAKDALNAANDEQFAAQTVPVMALLAETSAEGVKRVNKQELDRFVPSGGSFGRWIDAHGEEFLEGKIPTQYREEVGKMLDRMEAGENHTHNLNTRSIDTTLRQGAQQPVQGPKGGAQAKPEKSHAQSEVAQYRRQGNVVQQSTDGGKTWR